MTKKQKEEARADREVTAQLKAEIRKASEKLDSVIESLKKKVARVPHLRIVKVK